MCLGVGAANLKANVLNNAECLADKLNGLSQTHFLKQTL